jgi:hypothetical protein
LARFERSALPDHKGARTVVLRFLKIITPVKCVIPLYDRYEGLPKEGELLERFSRSGQLLPWNVNIDVLRYRQRMLRGFQLLWDA